MDSEDTFGRWLKRRRKGLDLTQAELARRVGCAEGTIRRLEADELRPSKQLAELLAERLELPPADRAAFVSFARGMPDSAPPVLPNHSAVPRPVGTDNDQVPVHLPSGTVTFLFTDVEASTRLWEQNAAAMRDALARHDALLREAITSQSGAIFKTVGDSVCAAFASAPNALAAALEAQRMLQNEQWGQIGPLRVRMALHTGTAALQAADYSGLSLSRVVRILAAGHGGQILLSLATEQLVREHLPPGVTLCDLGTHRLKDLSLPEQIFQLVATELPATFPTLNTLDARRTNLPSQPTALLGREQEVAAISALLRRPDVRLVTLTGPGGIGKTRLGLQVTAELIEDFTDGVYFVDLAPIRAPDLVSATIAHTLGVQETAGQPLQERLKGYLRDKRLLLLLDNFEQVLDAAPLVADLLAATRELKVLVTSREALHLRGEKEGAVAPLALPDLMHLPPLDQLSQYAAVALFIERACDVRSDFQVTNATAPAVAEICARLDGLPLAIELAAARLKLFAPEALLARLSSRLALLTGGAHDLPARQQTIRATIDWSYNLLSDAEQRLFRRLGVFVGGCTLDAAEAVCHNSWPGRHGGEATEREHPTSVSVLEGLAALIDKNLVQQAAESSGDTRFEMLETIREYALEHLAASGELEVLRQRHAEYFLALAETAAPEVVGAQGQLWMNRLTTEYSNLRMVLAWSIPPQGQVDLRMRLAVALLWFWIIRNHWGEGYVWLTRAAVLARQIAIAPAVQANVLRAAGIIAQFRAEYLQAIAQLEESLSLSRRVGKRTEVAEALLFLGWIARERGDYARAEALEVEALALYQAEQHDWGYCLTLLSLGETALDRGDLVQATARCEDLRVLCGDSGQVILHIRAMLRLGRIAYLRGEYDHAQTLLEECRSLCQQTRAPSAVAEAQFELGRVARARGDGLAAAQQLTASLVGYREYWGNKREIAYCLEELAGLAATTQHPMRAARLFGAAEALRVSVGTPLPPVHRADYARDVALVRANMDEDAFAAAWAAGRAMSLEQAIAEAVDDAAAPIT